MLLFAILGKTARAADASFYVSSKKAQTYTFSSDAASIVLRSEKAGVGQYTIKISGISKGGLRDAAMIGTYADKNL